MIRRDDGGDWIIIEQIKHANLAAEIARAWGNQQSGIDSGVGRAYPASVIR
jgi:hypothetical protein